MGKLLTFRNPEDDPHAYGWLACTNCGFVSMHVWPVELEPCDLECVECGLLGHREVWNFDALLPMNEELAAKLLARRAEGEDE
tara:strand:- start:193 stop:441 length:249 start_codon:yes stop_codon:yes gene_type:complete